MYAKIRKGGVVADTSAKSFDSSAFNSNFCGKSLRGRRGRLFGVLVCPVSVNPGPKGSLWTGAGPRRELFGHLDVEAPGDGSNRCDDARIFGPSSAKLKNEN